MISHHVNGFGYRNPGLWFELEYERDIIIMPCSLLRTRLPPPPPPLVRNCLG